MPYLVFTFKMLHFTFTFKITALHSSLLNAISNFSVGKYVISHGHPHGTLPPKGKAWKILFFLPRFHFSGTCAVRAVAQISVFHVYAQGRCALDLSCSDALARCAIPTYVSKSTRVGTA